MPVKLSAKMIGMLYSNGESDSFKQRNREAKHLWNSATMFIESSPLVRDSTFLETRAELR